MKDLKLKFNVKGNPELSEAVQKRLLELGCEWSNCNRKVQFTDNPYLYVEYGKILRDFSPKGFMTYPCKEATLDDLYHIQKEDTFTFENGVEVRYDKDMAVFDVDDREIIMSKHDIKEVYTAENIAGYPVEYLQIKIGCKIFNVEEIKDLIKKMEEL